MTSRLLICALLAAVLPGLLACDLLPLPGVERDPRYRVIDIGPGSDGDGLNISERYISARPHDLDEAGEVVGRVRQGERHWGFYFSEATGLVVIEPFANESQGDDAAAMTIQDDGTVYGFADGHVQGNQKTPFSWTAAGGKVALHDENNEGEPWASNADTVVGGCQYNIRPCNAATNEIYFEDAIVAGAYGEGAARDISDDGMITGWLGTTVDGVIYNRPKVWFAGDEEPTDLGSLAGDPRGKGEPYAINNDGVVLGYSNLGVDPAQDSRPFRWTEDGGMVELPLYDDNENTRYVDLSDDGTMVGGNGNEALIVQDGDVVDLNHYIAADTGWHLEVAYKINEQGWIAGNGTLDGEPHMFLLVPRTSEAVE